MATVIKERDEAVYNRHGWVAWLALILATIALVLAWMAYNRTGQDLEDRVEQRVNRSIDSLQGQR